MFTVWFENVVLTLFFSYATMSIIIIADGLISMPSLASFAMRLFVFVDKVIYCRLGQQFHYYEIICRPAGFRLLQCVVRARVLAGHAAGHSIVLFTLSNRLRRLPMKRGGHLVCLSGPEVFHRPAAASSRHPLDGAITEGITSWRPLSDARHRRHHRTPLRHRRHQRTQPRHRSVVDSEEKIRQ